MYFSSRVAADRPINADVPEPEEQLSPDSGDKDAGVAAKPEQTPKASPPAPPPPPSKPRRRRRPSPALLWLGGLVVVAIGFIVLVVVAGGGGAKDDSTVSTPAPAPVVEAPTNEEHEAAPSPSAETGEALGYPTFATDNTTRIGGATPAENAAAGTSRERPRAPPRRRFRLAWRRRSGWCCR